VENGEKRSKKKAKVHENSKKSTTLDFSSGEYGKMSKTVKIDEKGSNNVEKAKTGEESRK
jgi:hypothetical protein